MAGSDTVYVPPHPVDPTGVVVPVADQLHTTFRAHNALRIHNFTNYVKVVIPRLGQVKQIIPKAHPSQRTRISTPSHRFYVEIQSYPGEEN